MTRLAVPKTYKLYIGGAFPRSESGRVYEVVTKQGAFLANAAKGSRKDARDAVRAARTAVSGWAGATGYNRGQVLYRIAELLEGRRALGVVPVGGERDRFDRALVGKRESPCRRRRRERGGPRGEGQEGRRRVSHKLAGLDSRV